MRDISKKLEPAVPFAGSPETAKRCRVISTWILSVVSLVYNVDVQYQSGRLRRSRLQLNNSGVPCQLYWNSKIDPFITRMHMSFTAHHGNS